MTATSQDLGQPQLHHPRVSIVLTADAPRESVDALIDIVRTHPRRDSLEVVVVSAGEPADVDASSPTQSFVRYVAAPLGAAGGELRANGMRHASGNVVFLLDSDRVIDESLVDTLLAPTITEGAP